MLVQAAKAGVEAGRRRKTEATIVSGYACRSTVREMRVDMSFDSSSLGGREPVHMAQSIALLLGVNLAMSELKYSVSDWIAWCELKYDIECNSFSVL